MYSDYILSRVKVPTLFTHINKMVVVAGYLFLVTRKGVGNQSPTPFLLLVILDGKRVPFAALMKDKTYISTFNIPSTFN